jgi:hypothetical protein
MTPRDALVLLRAALRSIQYLLGGHVQFPRERLGDVLEHADGRRFVVYRETTLRSADDAPARERAVLVFEMDVTGREAGEAVRDVLFDPVANVATPFFTGMPGFRRKLWLAGSDTGEFLELYEWASREDADRFVELLESLLAPFDVAGTASFEVVDADSVDAYVDSRAGQWRADGPARSRVSSAGVVVLAVAAFAVGYLVWRRRRRRRTARAEAADA